MKTCEKVLCVLFYFIVTCVKGSLNWEKKVKSYQGTTKKRDEKKNLKSYTIYKMLDKREIKWKEKGEKLIILR